MLSYEDVMGFVQEHFPENVSTKDGTEWNFRCPYCGDSQKSLKKKRFHLQYISEYQHRFHCFNCGVSGSFYDLYSHIYEISKKDAIKKFQKFSPDHIQKSLFSSGKNASEEGREEKEDFSPILQSCIGKNDTPESLIQQKGQRLLIQFLKNRGIDDDFYFCYSGKYKGRIIIPVWENGKMVYFQARRAFSGLENKYLNPSAEKENIILGREGFDPEKYIIITEGILDAKTIGEQGTTCLGASITDLFLKEVMTLTNKGVIIALDNDKTGIDNTKKLMGLDENHKNKESRYKKKLKYFFININNIKDINQLSKEKNIQNMYKYIVQESLDYFEAHSRLMIGF